MNQSNQSIIIFILTKNITNLSAIGVYSSFFFKKIRNTLLRLKNEELLKTINENRDQYDYL